MDNMTDFFVLRPRGESIEAAKCPCLFDEIVPKKGVAIINGESGTGKSLLCLWIAQALATGKRAFKSPIEKYPSGTEVASSFGTPPEKGSTLYFSGEAQEGIEGRIFAAESLLEESDLNKFPHEFNSRLPILNLTKTANRLNGNKQFDLIQTYISGWKNYYESLGYPIKLIIFDTLASCFYIKNEDDSGERQELFEALSQLSYILDCLVLVVTHPPKSTPNDKVNPRGSGVSRNTANLILGMARIKNSNKCEVSVEKTRELPSHGMKFKFSVSAYEGIPLLMPLLDNPPSPPQAAENSENLKKQKLTSTEEFVLLVVKILTAEDGFALKAKAFDYYFEDLECSTTESSTPLKKDTVRKRFERAINKLLTLSLIIDMSKNGIEQYVVSATNDSIPNKDVAPITEDKDAERLQKALQMWRGLDLKIPPII